MFAIENVVQTFPFLEEVEKNRPCFTQAEKQILYRIAFHKESFEEVQKIILQASAPHLKEEERRQLLEHHAGNLPKPPNSAAVQIENYIFQVQLMSYETEKANRMLEEVLKRSVLNEELDAMIAEATEKPLKPQIAQAAVKNEKSI